MVAPALKTRPLAETFGAEVIGVRLSGDIDPDQMNEIRALWLRYELLLFRDQEMTKDDQVGFSRLIGPLERHLREEWLNDTHPEILQISNIKKDGKPLGALADTEVGWHYDQIYLPRPAIGSLLASVVIPPQGGSTWFADMTAAYDRLPAALKALVDGRVAVQSYAAFNAQYSTNPNEKQNAMSPDLTHPLVRTHPYSGRRALYLCPGMTVQIVGLPKDESDAALAELFAWTIRPEFVYCHDWRLGDALLWDNACTMHRRDPFDGAHDRLMHRTTILPQPDRSVPF
ncbi:TauD/TfdA dioxygenase family protein [Polymorphobacter sp.]|uniref:TauD/TfdA dioxygenase family protein n=1 Tax=Polymorphobacter sp. TaxID=1909290 RepID=UPI003F7074D9